MASSTNHLGKRKRAEPASLKPRATACCGSGTTRNWAAAQSYRGMVERVQYVEELGFDWVSVAEHHYSPHRLTPAPIVSAAHLAAYSQKIKIAVLGPIVSQSNPVQVAEN